MTKTVPAQKRKTNHDRGPTAGLTRKPISARTGRTVIGSDGLAPSWSRPSVSSLESALTHLTVEDRVAQGRSARGAAPRSSHATLELGADRDPIALLEAQNAGRVPELVPIRYERMLASPLAFFRGAASVMAHDLSSPPSPGLRVQLSGDAHLLNFGGYASPERALVFDLNDFDETLPGPFEWDVKRLAASVEIAGRERGLGRSARSSAVVGVVRAYRDAMRKFARMGDLDLWYARLDAGAVEEILRAEHDRKLQRAFARGTAKARLNDSKRAFSKLTHEVDGKPRIVSDPPLIVPLAELGEDDAEASVLAMFRRYRRSLQPDRRVLLDRFRYLDLARKVVGIGSVGSRCWMMLLLGRDARDPLFLQIKEAEPSVLEPLLESSGLVSPGRRIIEGQRLMQASSDIFIGWLRVESDLDGQPRDYYVRQLRDWKFSLDPDRISPRGFARYATACGWTLARAHARSGDRIAIAAYLGASDRFDRAVADYAVAYADLNEQDHRALEQAVGDGRVIALAGA